MGDERGAGSREQGAGRVEWNRTSGRAERAVGSGSIVLYELKRSNTICLDPQTHLIQSQHIFVQ